MPKYNTPHELDGLIERLTGEQLTKRLKVLSNTIRENHSYVTGKQEAANERAKAIGDALIEAKRRLGHGKKWTRWRDANTDFSKRTADDYMRMSREWKNPKIVELRRKNELSLAAMNRVLRKPKPTDDLDLNDNDLAPPEFLEAAIRRVKATLGATMRRRCPNATVREVEQFRDDLLGYMYCDYFALIGMKIDERDPREIDKAVLGDQVCYEGGPLEGAEESLKWNGITPNLYETVDHHRKRKIRRKVTRALNRNRKKAC